MPTRILEYLQAYVTTLVFLVFIYMIPIDCKITITENMECSIVNVHAFFINLKVGVSLDYYALFTSSCSNMLCNAPNKE